MQHDADPLPAHPQPPLAQAVDLLLATALFVLTAVAAVGTGGTDAPVALRLAGAAAVTAPIAFRRRAPVGVLGVVLVAGVLAPGPAAFVLPALIALFTVASRRAWPHSVAAGVTTVLAFGAHRIVWGYQLPALAWLSAGATTTAAVVAGLYAATRTAYVGQLHDRARRAERERELLAERAVADERVRIARELHDVVAHNASLMVVQAQAADATAGGAVDDRTRRSLAAIADLGREAMSEMHRTLELLRPGEERPERVPQPGLGRLDALLGQARDAGLDVVLHVAGEPRPLPATLDLSAYRIVQEALTNVVRHAGPAHTTVAIAYGPAAVTIAVEDDGRGAPAELPSGSHGIAGMRERVALFGGTLRAGSVNGHGFRVEAVLPLGGGGR
jgi:signal transduction histidine kinase